MPDRRHMLRSRSVHRTLDRIGVGYGVFARFMTVASPAAAAATSALTILARSLLSRPLLARALFPRRVFTWPLFPRPVFTWRSFPCRLLF